MKYYSHNQMKEVNKEFTSEVINELKAFLVERIVDNMETKDLVEYVTNDLDKYYESMFDQDFLDDAQNYWEDSFDEVVEDIREYANTDFKKTMEERGHV